MKKACFVLLMIAVAVARSVYGAAAEDFSALLDEVWEWQLKNSPMFASQQGDRRYNDLWRDQRLSAIEARQAQARSFLQRVYAIDRNALNDSDQLNYELFRRNLQNDVDGFAFNAHLLPFSHRGGVQNLDSNTNYLTFSIVKDYEDWISRLEKIDQVIGQTITLAERGRKTDFMPARILLQRIPDQIETQLVSNAEASPFYAVFEDMPPTISDSEQQRLKSIGRDVIDETVLPAYRKLARYFSDTYLPAGRDSVGLSTLSNGSRWYEHRVRVFTTTSMSADEIHRLGLSEVRRIRDEMQSIIDDLGFDGGYQEFLEFLRSDPQFYFATPDALYESYLATSKRIDPELVRLFGKLPRMPYGVKPIPDSIAPDTTTAYYSRPAADGSRAGIYWVNLYKPEERPKYEIEVLTVHEAMPGHHLQIALQQELAELPKFRRFAGFTAFVEGWGLYSESLGDDLGLYQDPYSKFGQLSYEMWRAVRLVVDTGIHSKGWTRQQAIDFFMDNAAKTELDITNEIDRYIDMPAQALAYKIGQLKIQSLRDNAERMLGDTFDIRAFHDALLGGGALPLDLLQQRMDNWLTEQL